MYLKPFFTCKFQYLFLGAKRLIEHLHKHKVPFGLATSSSKESYELKVNKHHKELFSLFEYKTLGSSDQEVKLGKPHPDIFLVAANRFPDKPDPSKVLLYLCVKSMTPTYLTQMQ